MIVACVRTGTRYPVEYVYKLKAMVARHLPVFHSFVCLTDRPGDLNVNFKGIEIVAVSGLPGWWTKMKLFDPLWGRIGERLIYFDLDTVICGDLLPLINLDVEFGICSNFARAAGNKTWPCRYGSCVMTIGPKFGADIWRTFNADRFGIMSRAGHYGDQKAIEELIPVATLLQDVMPHGYFLGYRDLKAAKPPGCSIVVFAGNSKPHNCAEKWIADEWALS